MGDGRGWCRNTGVDGVVVVGKRAEDVDAGDDSGSCTVALGERRGREQDEQDKQP